MNHRFVDIKGQKVAFYESECRGGSESSSSVVFVHGNSLSSRIFQAQFESPLGSKYRIVALDLPGHGMSGPAADPSSTYTVQGLVGIVAGFTEKVGLQDSVFVGHSLGGNLLLEGATLLSSARGFMLIGSFLPSLPADMARITYPHPALAAIFKPDLTDDEINDLAAAFMRPGAVPPAFVKEDIRKSDTRFRSYMGAALAQGLHQDEVSIAADLKTPLALVIGAGDQLSRKSYLRELQMPSLWRGDLQIIPDAGHLPQWEQPETLNGIIEEFITDLAGAKGNY